MTTSTTSPSDELVAANATLSNYVEEMLQQDKRFKGMSRYVYDINFYWSTAINTACAGHGFIFFNPNWWDKMVHEERKTVIAHEIYHLVCNHLERGRDKDPESYAQAIDHVVNQACEDDGFMTKHTFNGRPNTDFGDMGMVLDHRFKGMGSDAIYKIIHEERKKDPKSHPQSGAPSSDEIEDLVKEALKAQGSGKDLQQQADENEKARKEAVANGLEPGQGAGTNQEILRTEGKSVWILKAPYEEIFEDYLTDPLSGGKRTFMRPSRRQMRGEPRLKGKFPKKGRKNRLAHLAYALDVSGSIQDYEKKQFLRSAKTLKEKLNPALMTVMLWDDGIRYEKVYREDEELDNISIHAGGGTNLNPVYKRMQQIQPTALVIFTDLQVSIPPQPEWDTIWFVSTEKVKDHYLQKVTYGDVYLIPEER
ncbi:HNH endonuclease [Dinoroseobacter phage vB_DshP-R7L]|uniref:Metallopeptidase domain protein n=1 Tax=Dinoroseobacter phage vB_DshP-R7L TaxID=2873349 RepID=A0AAE8XEF4_9CAUD|nr:HNH endonuclease [Dinoroseobacter phage vB_DshP-R7L]UAT28864.1 hypothetical protein R7L_gp25 [Dinoroseobacter phage vB_DshP-R7L]